MTESRSRSSRDFAFNETRLQRDRLYVSLVSSAILLSHLLSICFECVGCRSGPALILPKVLWSVPDTLSSRKSNTVGSRIHPLKVDNPVTGASAGIKCHSPLCLAHILLVETPIRSHRHLLGKHQTLASYRPPDQYCFRHPALCHAGIS